MNGFFEFAKNGLPTIYFVSQLSSREIHVKDGPSSLRNFLSSQTPKAQLRSFSDSPVDKKEIKCNPWFLKKKNVKRNRGQPASLVRLGWRIRFVEVKQRLSATISQKGERGSKGSGEQGLAFKHQETSPPVLTEESPSHKRSLQLSWEKDIDISWGAIQQRNNVLAQMSSQFRLRLGPGKGQLGRPM